MRKLFLLSILSTCFFYVNAQVTHLAEDFNTNTACTSPGHHYPTGWINFNVEANMVNGANTLSWNCAPNGGRYNTPGLNCTGLYANSVYLDSAWFISPMLNLSGYANSVYLHFDTKATHIRIGEKLQVLYSGTLTVIDSNTYPDTAHFIDISQSINPIYNDTDSSDWVTHEVDLTPYKNQLTYIAFRYTSSAGGTPVLWSLDNINTTPTSLSVANQNIKPAQLSIVNTSQSEIVVSYSIKTSATYDIIVYDMLGRRLFAGTTYLQSGSSTYNIDGLHLQHDAFYFVKMGTDNKYEVMKTVFH